jgi:hypothetical protein
LAPAALLADQHLEATPGPIGGSRGVAAVLTVAAYKIL